MMHRVLRLVLVFAFFAIFVGAAAAAPVQQQAQYATPVAVVNTSFLNVRTGPGAQYTILITVVGGTTLQVMGISADGSWLQVSTPAGLGWVNVQFTLPRGNFEFVPVVSAPPVVESAPRPEFSGSTGSDDSSADAGFASGRLWGASILDSHMIRLTPAQNGLRVGDANASDGAIYRVLDATFADGIAWVKLEFNPQLAGWVEQSKVLFRPYGCGFTIVRVTRDVTLQRGPDGSGTDGVGLANNHEAYLLDRVGELYKLELQSGAVGWIDGTAIAVRDENTVAKPPCTSSAQLSGSDDGRSEGGFISPPVVSGPYVVVNTGYLNIRSGAGAQYSSVATVPGGTRLPVVGVAPDGVWYQVHGDFGLGWLNIEYALFRGDGRSLPIIRDTAGETAKPIGTFRYTLTVYAAPNLTLGVVGTLPGPGELTVLGRTEDSLWIQVATSIGNGWVQRDLVTIVGNTAAIPVVH